MASTTKMWVKDPHSGGVKIPDRIKEKIKDRIECYANKNYAGKFTRIDVRFRGYFCYIDAYQEPFVPEDFDPVLFNETREERIERLRNAPIKLCRLRYKGDENNWTLDFFSYSHDKYQPSVFTHGGFYGTPEQALQSGAMFLE
jgi:hypothetical protein